VRTSRLWAVGLAAGTLVGAMFVFSNASGASSVTREETYGVEFHTVPVLRKAGAVSLGDQVLLHDTLTDPRTNRPVGHDGGVCVLESLAGLGEYACTITFVLPRGSVTTQFVNAPPPTKLAAITGGTGAYRGARGQAVLHEFGSLTLPQAGIASNNGVVVFQFEP